jgi:hypothetical protein
MKCLLVGLVTAVVVCGLTLAWSVRRQEVVLQPCPFDPSLHVGIAFQGPHRYFHTGEVQEKIINARIAWFQPVEEPNPDAFDARVSQEPSEEDWDWWTTLYPTTLIVQVTDKQKRLGKAEIRDFETKLLDGQLEASADGSTISGSLVLEEPTSFRQLIIKDKSGQTLAQALLRDPETRLWIVASRAGWIPHPPPRDIVVEITEQVEHEGGHTIVSEVNLVKRDGQLVIEQTTETRDCLIQRYRVKEGCPPHTGDINEQHLVKLDLTFGPPPTGCDMVDTRVRASCGTWVEVTPFPITFTEPYCMTKRFRNDNPSQINIYPPKVYKNKHVLVKLKIDLRSYPLVTKDEPSQAQLVTELEQMQDETKTTLLTTSIPVPPFSEGCVHWDLIPDQAEIRGIWAVPYRKYKKTETWFNKFLLSIHKPLLDAIMGRHKDRKELIVEAAIEAWVKGLEKVEDREREIWRWDDAVRIGDIWVLYLKLAGQEPMPYLRNITQDVHVQIVVVRPDGTKEPMYGSLTVERLEATTTPEPPKSPLTEQFTVEEVPKEGKKIALGKGWKWKLTGFAAGMKGVKEIKVPLEPPSVTIEIPAPQPPPDEG